MPFWLHAPWRATVVWRARSLEALWCFLMFLGSIRGHLAQAFSAQGQALWGFPAAQWGRVNSNELFLADLESYYNYSDLIFWISNQDPWSDKQNPILETGTFLENLGHRGAILETHDSCIMGTSQLILSQPSRSITSQEDSLKVPVFWASCFYTPNSFHPLFVFV